MSQNKYLKKKTKRNEMENKEQEDKNYNDCIMEMENNKHDIIKKEEIKDSNIIIGNIKVEKTCLRLRILNSYENTKRENKNLFWGNVKAIENEEQIKNCEIFINNIKINFNYYYEFPKEGIYEIKYIFKNLLKSTNFMFYGCYALISLDLSNFYTKNITNMEYMFFRCNSLIELNLSNFDTKNVTNMEYMFCGCKSLKSLDLSNFDTKNVTNMEYMFFGCNSLITLNISNFDTKNVINNASMLEGCNSLINLFQM